MTKWERLRQGPYRDVMPNADETALITLIHSQPFDETGCLAWLDASDLDNAPGGILRLMPPLYKRMQDEGVSHRETPRLAGIYRHTRFRNRILLHRGAKLVAGLEQLGIDCLLLKGASVVLHPKADLGTRPMADFDILVPEDTDLDSLMDALTPHLDFDLELLLTVPIGVAYGDPSGLEYDLHTHLRPNTQFDGSTTAYWRDATELRLGEAKVRGLRAEHFVFHTILHGLEYNEASPLRWISDVLFALDINDGFDWDHLFRHANDNSALEPVRVGVSCLLDMGLIGEDARGVFEQWATVSEPRWLVNFHRELAQELEYSRWPRWRRFACHYLLKARQEKRTVSLSSFAAAVKEYYGDTSGSRSLLRMVYHVTFAWAR